MGVLGTAGRKGRPMASFWQTTWDSFWKGPLPPSAPSAAAAAPAPLPTEVKQFLLPPDTSTHGLAHLPFPTVTQAFGGNPYTLNSAIFACLQVLAKAFQEAP